MKSFLNGRFVDHEKAVISVDDHGFLYGDGVYETLRVYNGHVFLLKEHLARLKHSASWIGLSLPMSLKTIGHFLKQTARRNGLLEAVLRLTITRGPGEYGFDPALCLHPTIAIVARPFRPYPRWYHEKGITLAMVSIRRNSPLALPPHVKSTSCMNGIYAKRESLRLKAQEGAFLSHHGTLSEGTVSNLFLVKQGRVYTPKLDGNLLAGTTRGFVVQLAANANIPVKEMKLNMASLIRADEVFLTNTTMEILPVTTVVDATRRNKSTRRFRLRHVGAVTRRLMASFSSYKERFYV